MKRSPLRRGAPLARSSAPMRRSRLAPVSAKRAAVRDERRAYVERILRERPTCEACRILGRAGHVPWLRVSRPWPSTDVHELVRRSQGSPIVPSQGLTDDGVRALCRTCHSWVTEHPAEAVALGLARWGSRSATP